MTPQWLERTELLIKKDGLEKLAKAHCLVIGLGGVGSFAAEFLARTGIGKLTIVDGDVVDITNINRQLPAMHSTIGLGKAELMKQRILDINPQIELKVVSNFMVPEEMESLLEHSQFDFVLDCIDSISPKLALIMACRRRKIKMVSAMGAGGKMDPAQVRVRDISKTNNCTMARHLRKRLKKAGVTKGLRCVFSTEIQREDSLKLTDGSNFKKSFYGTISYMPALFGLYAAAEAVKHLLKNTGAH